MKRKDLLSIADLDREDIKRLIATTEELKSRGWLSLLERKVLALIFEKPSLRTRVSFEVAMMELGGRSIYLSPAEVGLGKRESVPDVARVLSRYVDIIAARTFSHQSLEVLARYSRAPVINALSDLEHPCQALADLFTIYEQKGELEGLTLAFIGDGNNVAHSLMLAASLSGVNFRIASPPGYEVREEILHLAKENAEESRSEIFCTTDPALAAKGADIIYTDVWTSMGQEDESEARRKAFSGYQVNDELLSLAQDDAIVMHPLPAHRGEEVSENILDSPRSVIFDQAENRMHTEKALLVEILGGAEITSLA